MKLPEHLIANARLLTERFGRWPSFHDAEVLELSLARSGDRWGIGGLGEPILTTRVYVFEMTSKVMSSGNFELRHKSVVTLRFEGVEGLELDSFNHQNVLASLLLEPLPGELPRVSVTFEPTYGLAAAFTCSRVEVVQVEDAPTMN